MGSHQSGKSGNLVAQLPWLETPANATCKLEDTDFYKQLCDNGSRRGKFREKLYQFYNETVPFYLPLRYSFSSYMTHIS